jgi:hypothetical protein
MNDAPTFVTLSPRDKGRRAMSTHAIDSAVRGGLAFAFLVPFVFADLLELPATSPGASRRS